MWGEIVNIESLQSLMLNDNGFAFHPTTGESFQCSETGVAVIRQLLHGTPEEDLAIQIAGEFDVDVAIAERDIDGFLLNLKELQLITI